MKKNIQSITLILMMIAAFSLGCKMLGGNKISNEQISKDLLETKISVKSGLVMDKEIIVTQCFKVKESKFEGDSGELTIDLFRGEKSNSFFGIGEITATYKKSGDSWMIQNIKAKDYDVKMVISDNQGQEILKKGAPLCGSYDSKLKAK